jgi:glucose-6-phosphate isomerase
LREFVGLYADEQARKLLDQDQIVYRIVIHVPVPESTVGALLFGTSLLEPGRVGDEYFMTKGHFHEKRNTAEYYWGISGQGVLILMDENRRCWAEQVWPGSLHHIPGRVAHRLANTGDSTLAVGACWPADAGHDYSSIADRGFSARLKDIDGIPQLVEEIVS